LGEATTSVGSSRRVVGLLQERSPDQSSSDRKGFWCLVPDHFFHRIPAYFFYVPVLDDPRYIVGAGADTSVSFGAFLELLLIIANIGTAVVLYPILKRQNEILSSATSRLVSWNASSSPSAS
jgi:hypothetical protein